MPPETLYGYLEGDDPLTGQRVIDEIVDALTKTPSGAEAGHVVLPSEEVTGSRGAGRTGHRGQPPAPVLRTRLDGRAAGRPPHRGAGGTHARPVPADPATSWSGEIFLHDTKEMLRYTVSDIAVVAVMAGARPEHLPVILAIASTRHSALTPSTTPFGSMLLVNGPIRNEISMNSGVWRPSVRAIWPMRSSAGPGP